MSAYVQDIGGLRVLAISSISEYSENDPQGGAGQLSDNLLSVGAIAGYGSVRLFYRSVRCFIGLRDYLWVCGTICGSVGLFIGL